MCGESVIARVSTYRFRLVSHFLTAARRVAFVQTRGSLKLRLSKVQRALTLIMVVMGNLLPQFA